MPIGAWKGGRKVGAFAPWFLKICFKSNVLR